MHSRLIISLLLSWVAAAFSQGRGLPAWFRDYFDGHQLGNKYGILHTLKPDFITADLDGDHKEDVAVFLVGLMNGKKGILILPANKKKYFLLGAGISFGNGGDDFSWVKEWGTRSTGHRKRALFISDPERGGGRVQWNGKNFLWIQEGD